MSEAMTPRETVEALDKYIVGQDEAKRAVAIALRNRYRRSRLPQELRDEITPKNIIMMGPTGVGKTEIARRLAKLVDAPFVKVEATKFTEVGYVGRDVDSMVRDLVEAAIRICKEQKMNAVRTVAEANAEQRLIDILVPMHKDKWHAPENPLQFLLGGGTSKEPELTEDEKRERLTKREEVTRDLRAGRLEDEIVEVQIEMPNNGSNAMIAMGIDVNLNEMMGGILPPKKKTRRVKVSEARKLLVQDESEKLIDMDEITQEAIERAEQDGIIFIDEIDKIAASGNTSGADVSREGVQRDILPIVEGSTVTTKYGPVNKVHTPKQTDSRANSLFRKITTCKKHNRSPKSAPKRVNLCRFVCRVRPERSNTPLMKNDPPKKRSSISETTDINAAGKNVIIVPRLIKSTLYNSKVPLSMRLDSRIVSLFSEKCCMLIVYFPQNPFLSVTQKRAQPNLFCKGSELLCQPSPIAGRQSNIK